jgi:hypothetical protein
MFNNGDRVMALWAGDNFWYPGTVQSSNSDSASVLYDDGSRANLFPGQLCHLNLNPGSRVLGKWKGGTTWYAGRITALKGDQVHIQYDDGDQESTTLRMVRQRAEDVTPGLGVGSRILGRWKGGSTEYAGKITQRNGDQVHVQYDDGDQEWTTLAMVRPA